MFGSFNNKKECTAEEKVQTSGQKTKNVKFF